MRAQARARHHGPSNYVLASPSLYAALLKTAIGYEIPFTKYFYEYTLPRPLEVIEAEIRGLEDEIRGMLGEVLR